MGRLGRTIPILLVSFLSLTSAAPAVSAAGESPVYVRTDYAIRDLPHALWPYIRTGPGPLQGSQTFDEEGVSIRVINGVAYDHPVLQAQYILGRLSSYEYNHDPAYLDSVRAHADRLIANAVSSRGALYLPYPFNFALHGYTSDRMPVPWYSAMAQGQALSAFVRLYETTGEQKYRDAADGVFASFQNLKADGVPWVVEIDEEGYLWFEEYAKDPGPDRTFNGHIFAIFGLWDYYRLTGSEDAKALFQGGVAAVERYLPDIRNTGWISQYCLSHPEVASAGYHGVHVGQLYQLYNMTGATSLAVAADRLIEDYPSGQLAGRGYLGAGSHLGLRLDSSGVVVDSKVVTLDVALPVMMGERGRIAGQDGIWLRLDTGMLRGYWVQEAKDRVFMKLSRETYSFDRVRLIRFDQGTYSGYTFNSLGLRVRATRKTATLRGDSAAHVDQRTLMNGVTYFRVVDGIWADRWIPAQSGVSLE